MVRARTHASTLSLSVITGFQKGSNVSSRRKAKNRRRPAGETRRFHLCVAVARICSSRYRLQGIPGSHLDPKIMLVGRFI
jgi:hypothetical protein